MKEHYSLETQYLIAAQTIKTAILQSQYQAVKLVNKEQLSLYYGVGRYISQSSRNKYWGTGAIPYISNKLHKELPGLRGFSETNIRLMRIFYEEWKILDENSSVVTDELQLPNNKTNTNSSVTIDNLSILQNTANEIQLLIRPKLKNFPIEEFFKIGFTHHSVILSQVKILEERYFYIQLCAKEQLKVEILKKLIREDIFHNQRALPNNFTEKLPTV